MVGDTKNAARATDKMSNVILLIMVLIPDGLDMERLKHN